MPIGRIVLGIVTCSFVVAALAAEIQPPLATRGTEIVDRTGHAVVLRGISWFGMETETHVPHGLWARDWKEMLGQIRAAGFNLVRVPWSVNAIRSPTIGGIDFSKGSNADLEGRSPLEVLDRIIAEADRQGLLVLLDCHRLNDAAIPELWYGDGFTEDDWLDAWRTMARRYGTAANVIGADVKNEPHGAASWGTDDERTDFRLAAERCGDAIHEIAPHWLIVVEGVEKNVPGQQLPGYWWGGNLEGVRTAPVRLKVQDRVVYSPHEYGPGVDDADWLKEPSFPANLADRWDKGFFFIVREGIAPVLVGEFGGRETGADTREGVWQRAFVEFLRKQRLGFVYWSWNPNSGDTGGLLADDWLTIVEPKRRLLAPLLDGP
ncbi:MAG: glycoside hydrolase family 5 protein [Planctomycetaceae bacterium]